MISVHFDISYASREDDKQSIAYREIDENEIDVLVQNFFEYNEQDVAEMER